MKKFTVALMALIIISLCCAGKTKAQDSTSSKVKGGCDIGIDWKMGVKAGGCILINTFKPITITCSIGSNEAINLDLSILPFSKKGEKGKWLGFGVEGVCFTNFNWDVSSFIKDKADLSKAFNSKYTSLMVKELALSPFIKIQIPTKKCNLGIKVNPFIVSSWFFYKAGTWDHDSNGNWYTLHGWSVPKQYFSIAAYYNFSLTKGEKKDKTKK